MDDNVPVCRMRSSDYEALEKAMRSLVGWPVIFSCNTREGEIWIGNAVHKKGEATILTSASAPSAIQPAMRALRAFLLNQGTKGRGGHKFYIDKNCIVRQHSDQLWGQVEFDG